MLRVAMMSHPIRFLRHAALIEGVSFLVLLGIAMPLKYIWGEPMAVRIVGMIHGILFLGFCAALLNVKLKADWPISRAAPVFAAALIPFGPWLIDRRLVHYEQEYQSRRDAA